MEENYLLAKSIVDEKFNKNNEYYYMFICALFGFFMKYPDHKELIINSFKDTNIIIEDISVLDIQKKYDLNLIKDDELAVQDPKACINHGASDIGIGYFIQDKELQMIQDNPTIICSGKDNSPANLINIFVHELNHIIKSFYNSYGSKVSDGISSCYNRCGLTYTIFTYDKYTDILKEEEFYSILDEVINVFQTTEILSYILMLDGVVPDEGLQKYIDSLDKDELKQNKGYDKTIKLFKRIWDNKLLRDILEKHLIDGNLVEISSDFDEAVGMECFDELADLLDDLDYLFCLNNNKSDIALCYNMLDNLIKRITSYKIKK